MSTAKTHGHSHAHEHEHHHPGLKVEVEKHKGRADVKMTVEPAEIERARGQEYATLSKRVALKGFRPGKTPRAMLEKHFKADVEKSVIEHFVNHAFQQAVDEAELRPAAYPRIQMGDNVPGKGEPWSLTFEILLRPEVTLGQVEGLEIEGKSVAVTEEELDRALAEIRRANSRPEPAGEEALAADGMAVATLDFFRPGSKESVLTREGLRLTPATAPAGVDRATYERTLVGAKKGEQRSMPMEFTAGFPIEEARGERGEVRFTFQEILRVVPPADEEVFKAFGASDEASLRTAVRARIEKAKSESEEQRIETELLERLIQDHAMELPQRLVDDQVEASQSELRAELAKQGLSEEEAKTRADGERERARAGAEKALKAAYLIEEIARAKELRVESADLSAELTSIAERNGTPVADVAKYYREEGLMRQLGLELLERKVRRYLRASAAIKTSS